MPQRAPLLKRLTLAPWRLVIDNASIFIVAGLALLLERALDVGRQLRTSSPPSLHDWYFTTIPHVTSILLMQPALIILLCAAFVLKSVTVVYFVLDIALMHIGSRRGPRKALYGLRLSRLLRFLAIHITTYLIAGTFFITFYALTLYLYRTAHVDLSYIVLVSGIVMFPLLYAVVTFAAFLCAIPLSGSQVRAKLAYVFLSRSRLTAAYLFYFARAIGDTTTVILLPVALLWFSDNLLVDLAGVAVGVGILITFLRGSSVAFKFYMFEGDAAVQQALDELRT